MSKRTCTLKFYSFSFICLHIQNRIESPHGRNEFKEPNDNKAQMNDATMYENNNVKGVEENLCNAF